jgi:hypothetical protein
MDSESSNGTSKTARARVFEGIESSVFKAILTRFRDAAA